MSNKKKLLQNTAFLYVLTFSNYLFNFITIPYQTRILGAEYYGKLGFALSFMTYFQLILDFGFILSSTEEVSVNRKNKMILGKILSAVTLIKIFLIFSSCICLVGICVLFEALRPDLLLYILYFVYTALNSLIPDYLFRGMENMKVITIRSVGIKFIFVILIFVFLKDRSQYYLVPILNTIGVVISLFAVYSYTFYKLEIKFVKVSFSYVKSTFIKSSKFFLSRIASTMFSSTNTVVLKFVYPIGPIVGLYSVSDKLIVTIKSMFTPISDSLYPYMVKNKDFKLIKKILIYFMPFILIGCLILYALANPICTLLFGKEFSDAAIYLKLMVPLLLISLPNMLLGYPTLNPLGMSKQANLSIIFGSILQVIELLILFLIKQLTVETIIISTCITEFFILIYRSTLVLRRRKNIG